MILIDCDDGKTFETYIELHDKYNTKYGKACILYHCGTFYEIYGKEGGGGKQGDIYTICGAVGLTVAVKDKASGWLMGGFNPVHAEKYVPLLVECGYTVVMVDQISPAPKPKRAITRIVSHATYLDDMSLSVGAAAAPTKKKNNNKVLMSVYVEFTRHTKFLLAVSMAAMDVSLGESVLYTVYAMPHDKERCLDECFRFIHSMGPVEIMFLTDDKEECLAALKDKIREMGIEELGCHCHEVRAVPKEFLRPEYQQSFLATFFRETETGMLSPVEYLHLTTLPSLVVSLCVLLQFTYDHDETLTQQLHQPRFWDQHQYLTIENNGIYQLNITPTHHIKQSLIELLDHTSTSVGRRLHRERLLNPVVNPKVLNERYAQVGWMCQGQRYVRYEGLLKKISDIERLHRKIENGTISPQHFMLLESSYKEIAALIQLFVSDVSESTKKTDNNNIDTIDTTWAGHFAAWRQAYLAIFNLAECQKYRLNNITGSLFNRGISPAIDAIQAQTERLTAEVYGTAARLSQCLRPHVGSGGGGGGSRYKDKDKDKEEATSLLVKVEKTERDGYYYSVSKGRTDLFKKYAEPELAKMGWEVASVVYQKLSVTKVTINNLTRINQTLEELQEKLQDQCRVLFVAKVQALYEAHKHIFPQIVQFIASLDWLTSAAKCATVNFYCRPHIISSSSSKSFFHAKGLRHPMIEKLLATHYVPNDILLGEKEGEEEEGGEGGEEEDKKEDKKGEKDKKKGEKDKKEEEINANAMLLFGTNSSGKSSLMKSVGICVIMAQSGLFVPCDALTYYPYLNILTRIAGEDNFSKGFSSFVVEMVELRTILLRSTPRSLVLGDEICHGTEQTSALAIVASSIVELAHRDCTFIFATHLHSLSTMGEIVALEPRVQCKHLKVTYDEAGDMLVYNRKLDAGAGSSLYGLEVAKYIIQDQPDFIARCVALRKKIMDVPTQVVSTRTSKYNVKLVVDKCKICGKRADDTHHINFQCTADEWGCIDASNVEVKFHKHTLGNLVALCKGCHIKVHHSVDRKKFVIHGYEQTSKGTILRWSEQDA